MYPTRNRLTSRRLHPRFEDWLVRGNREEGEGGRVRMALTINNRMGLKWKERQRNFCVWPDHGSCWPRTNREAAAAGQMDRSGEGRRASNQMEAEMKHSTRRRVRSSIQPFLSPSHSLGNYHQWQVEREGEREGDPRTKSRVSLVQPAAGWPAFAFGETEAGVRATQGSFQI